MNNKIKMQHIKTLVEKDNADWYRMSIDKENDVADVYIYDEISWFGITAQNFVKELNAIDTSTIRLHINSPGGNVFDGIAIYNALVQHKATVETYIEGLAASTSSIVALAGDKVYMSENAFYMIHDPWVLAIGSAKDLRKTADILDKITSVMIKTYMKASGQQEKTIRLWLAAETWFTAEEAKEAGFIDGITDKIEAESKYDLSMFDNVPADLLKELNINAGDKKIKQGETKKYRELMRMQIELAESIV